MNAVVVLGGGGHAKVVVSTCRAAGFEVSAVLDDDPARLGTSVLGVRVAGPIELGSIALGGSAVIAVGDNRVRQKIASRPGVSWTTAVHPSAVVDGSVRLGEGTVVFAGAVVQPDAQVGRHAVLNTRAVVEHDVTVGDFAHVAPGAVLAGGVRVGEGALIGAGAVVCPGRTVGAWSVVGAGAVVVADVPPGVVAVGVPARVRRTEARES
ncbi:MAG: NeuD/PglB/VioB family sugar acetyltransferase [Isosphaeraceae bacterium]